MFTVTITDICYLIQPLRFVSMPSQFSVTVYVMKLFETCLGWDCKPVSKLETQRFLRRFYYYLHVVWGNSVLTAVIPTGRILFNLQNWSSVIWSKVFLMQNWKSKCCVEQRLQCLSYLFLSASKKIINWWLDRLVYDILELNVAVHLELPLEQS